MHQFLKVKSLNGFYRNLPTCWIKTIQMALLSQITDITFSMEYLHEFTYGWVQASLVSNQKPFVMDTYEPPLGVIPEQGASPIDTKEQGASRRLEKGAGSRQV